MPYKTGRLGLTEAATSIVSGLERGKERRRQEAKDIKEEEELRLLREKMARQERREQSEFIGKYGAGEETVLKGEATARARAAGMTGVPSPSPEAMREGDFAVSAYERLVKKAATPKRQPVQLKVSDLNSAIAQYERKFAAGEELDPEEEAEYLGLKKQRLQLLGVTPLTPKPKPEPEPEEPGFFGKFFGKKSKNGISGKTKSGLSFTVEQ